MAQSDKDASRQHDVVDERDENEFDHEFDDNFEEKTDEETEDEPDAAQGGDSGPATSWTDVA